MKTGSEFTSERRSHDMAKTAPSSFPGDDFGKLLVLGGALISLGVLPRGWQKTISAATALYILYKLW
jgi:hypothetical protein